MFSLANQTGLVLLVGVLAAMVTVFSRGLPDPVPPQSEAQSCAAPAVLALNPPKVSAPDAFAMAERGEAIFVDCRSEAEYQQGHVAGAISLPAEHLALSSSDRALLLTAQTVVAYCDAACARSTKVAHHIMEVGVGDVRILEGGIDAWSGAGYPAESGPSLY